MASFADQIPRGGGQQGIAATGDLDEDLRYAQRIPLGRPLTPEWRQWLRLKFDRGCDGGDLPRRAQAQGFDPQAIARELEAPELSSRRWAAWPSPPLLDPSHRPRG